MTFLFTDIDDSTRAVRGPGARHGRRAARPRRDRARHDRTARRVRVRERGDGFCAAFSTAADAAAAAIESQEQLRDDSDRRLRGSHGPPHRRGGRTRPNYFGSEVNRAARLMSIAHGGQVLVSDATEVLLRDRVTLRPLGEHRLRGLRGRMSVYQVVADGLPADFPVLRSVDDFAGQPPAAAELGGRARSDGRRGRRARAVAAGWSR